MTRVTRSARWSVASLALLLAGCTSGAARTPVEPQAAIRLVAFSSCDDLLTGVRAAAKSAVGAYGFGGGLYAVAGAGNPVRAAAPGTAADSAGAKAGSPETQQNDFSGTNTHEAGVDEPDLVKTDGKRIITVHGGVLRVVDAASRRVTGSLRLDDASGYPGLDPSQLLLAGDRALVLVQGGYGHATVDGPVRVAIAAADGVQNAPVDPGLREPAGPLLLLVDLTGGPHLTGQYTVDGDLVDARQVGAEVRVVVHSGPRIIFPANATLPNEMLRITANQAAIDRTSIADWLPRYAYDDPSGHHSGQVDCGAVSRPHQYTGSSMLTVLSFDLGAPSLGSGDPVTVIADGETVYSNGPSLYVAGYPQYETPRMPARTATELYKFDTSGAGRPAFVAAGAVPGYLLNQYSLSEFNGSLRIATTSAQPWETQPVTSPGIRAVSPAPTESTVYVLRQQGKSLVETGRVGGLGKGESIYAVRFVGPAGYVVTFRQTDPLYTLDLSDPTAPKLAGELKINGYSAYLHPAGAGRLLGIGQDATAQGQVRGTQVSLFDVTDPAHTNRIGQYRVQWGHSDAEFDPHAFLYWPATRLLVIPISAPGSAVANSGGATVRPSAPAYGALALRVDDAGFTELGLVTHPAVGGYQYASMIHRSLIIGDTLWTISDAGLAADNAATLTRLAWIPFS